MAGYGAIFFACLWSEKTNTIKNQARNPKSKSDEHSSLLGCRMVIPVGKWVAFVRCFFFSFPVGKSLACHSPGNWCPCA